MSTTAPGCVTICLPSAPPARPMHVAPRPAVLVVVSPDGFLECYATPGVRVAIAERLRVADADEQLADEYLDSQLPAWAKEVFAPIDLVASRMPRPRTAEEEIERRTAVELVTEAVRRDARNV